MRLSKAPPVCPGCSGAPIRNGAGRLLCKVCGRTFAPRSPFPRARVPGRIILEALVLSECNFSDISILSHLRRAHAVPVSRQTLSSWRRKFRSDWMDYSGAFSGRELSLEQICRMVGLDFG